MIYSVILSGGVGSRLWPISRKTHPKPFIKIANGLSILQHTILRALELPSEGIINVTSADFLFKIQQEWAELRYLNPELLEKSITPLYLLEPFGRNTAAAMAMVSFWMAEIYGQEVLLLVLPSDHLIENQRAFQSAVAQASQLALQNKIVTFGITPTSPQTGYGYIEYENDKVKRFVEKPPLELAERYVASGNYLWNSGIFCFKVGVMLEEMALHCQDIVIHARTCFHSSFRNKTHQPDFLRIDPNTFRTIRDHSIDYAVMEKSDKIAVVPCDMGWSDVGTWNAISELVKGDEQGNVMSDNTITQKVKNCYIESSSQRLIAAVGVDNLVIVDTPDALLVAHKDNAQDVKDIYTQLAKAGHQAHEIHTTVYRPWGSYTVLEQQEHVKIKRICVHPRASLSLQSHQHRSEHWILISGSAQVINGEKNLLLHVNQSTYIPAGNKHRLSNPSDSENLVIIEVQTGNYVGEDDIQRYEDLYGRCEENI